MSEQKREILSYSESDGRAILAYRAKSPLPRAELSEAQFLELFSTNIIEGLLECKQCSQKFPIEQGIPVLLPVELRTVRGVKGRANPLSDERLNAFLDNTKRVTSEDRALFDNVQRANQSNYGYEWKAFSHDQRAWEDVYFRYYVQEERNFFPGKLGLDAGCGMGRYSTVASSLGAEVLGLDLSNAIEVSYERSLKSPLFHAVQGDIFNLPLRSEFFDFAQTLGVIHITPDPEAALLSLKRVLRQGGHIWIYVYPSFKDENKFKYYALKLVNQARRITVQLPANFLYALLWLVAPLMWLLFYVPTMIFHKLGMRKLAATFPYSYEQYKGRRLRDFHMNLFDRFGNPAERRYDRDEIYEWMNRASFSAFKVWFKDGWTVGATK